MAIAVRADGVSVKPRGGTSLEPFGAVHFWVGQRGQPALDMKAPMLVYSEPRGTYNGAEAADNVLLDFYLLGAKAGAASPSPSPDVASNSTSSSATGRHAASPACPAATSASSSSLLGADEKPLAGPHTRAQRTITVNRDAPVAEGRP